MHGHVNVKLVNEMSIFLNYGQYVLWLYTRSDVYSKTRVRNQK